MTDAELIRASVAEGIAVKRRMAEAHVPTLLAVADLFTKVLRQGGTIYLCGNGGSAADAQHIAAEFVGRFLRERRPLPSVALTTNTSILTAIGNDYDYKLVFARQVRAQVTPRDVVCGISTSGKSPNVIEAMRAAREVGAAAVGWTGEPGEPLASECDLCLKVPSSETPRIQEAQILAWHLVCDVVERRMVDAS